MNEDKLIRIGKINLIPLEILGEEVPEFNEVERNGETSLFSYK